MLHAQLGMRQISPFTVAALVSHHNPTSQVNCAAYYCGFARSSRAQKLFCEWNTRYALVARALAIFSHWGGKIRYFYCKSAMFDLRDSYQLPSILLIFVGVVTKQMFHLEPCNDRDFAFDERSRRTVANSASLRWTVRRDLIISCEINWPVARLCVKHLYIVTVPAQKQPFFLVTFTSDGSWTNIDRSDQTCASCFLTQSSL